MTDRELLEALYNDMQVMKSDIQTLDRKVAAIELTLENETNHNIQLLVKNHVYLADRLSQAIHAQDKATLYEVQISGLKMKIEKLEQEVAEIKSKTA